MSYINQTNIGLLLKKRAQINPHVEAFVEFERARRFSFSDLNSRCNRIANSLLALGVKPGDRVATLLKNGIEFVESYFAAAKIGAILVPVNWRLVAPEIAYILNDAGATTVLYDADFDSVVDELQALEHGLAPVHWIRHQCELLEQLPAPDYSRDYNDLLHSGSEREPPVGAWDDELLFIMYTSGTTGHPKGAMHSHDAMLWAQLTSMTTSDMRGDDNFLLPMPMFHVGSLLPVSQLVHRGAKGIIMREIEMSAMFRAIEQEQVSITMSVPALLQFMLMAPERSQYSLDSIRWIATGAAPVPLSLLEEYERIGIAIYQAYGLTESCGPGTLLSPHDARTKPGSAGTVQMHTEAKIVDEQGRTIPPGSEQAGELLLAGRHMMKGYWNNPEATAAALQDGWLHTGDICTMDAEGCIRICDRKKDMIISGGENIYPAELEKVLSDCPQVLEAAVIGVSSDKWGETPLALVVAAPGASPDEQSLRAYCREQLAGYKIPGHFRVVDSLPRNASGKLLKNQLREMYGRRSD